jgi:hypothetical protein
MSTTAVLRARDRPDAWRWAPTPAHGRRSAAADRAPAAAASSPGGLLAQAFRRGAGAPATNDILTQRPALDSPPLFIERVSVMLRMPRH